jgi:threonine synthase
MKDTHFICTYCKKIYSSDHVHPRCDECHEPLEIELVKRGTISEGNSLHQTILERYADFSPFVRVDKQLSLGEGFTPLVTSPRLSSELGIKKIFFKNESQNPTWSFKDRGTVFGIQHAVRCGYERVGTVSSGNMAASVAAYGSKAGLRTIILVSAAIPAEKLNPISMYGPMVITVDGDYGDLYFRSLEIGKQNDIYFINSDVPFRVEGSKTIAYEICEQMNFEAPDYVVVPTSSGGNIRGILKGFKEFKLSGFIDRVPRMICAQASGCSPIYNAYAAKKETISRVDNPETIAHAIENPFPPSGNEVLRKLRDQNGIFVAVSDDEILHAQKRLAEDGIFGQPASAVGLAAVMQLVRGNMVKADDTIVCIITGGGLKYTAIYEKHDVPIFHCSLDNVNSFIAHHA